MRTIHNFNIVTLKMFVKSCIAIIVSIVSGVAFADIARPSTAAAQTPNAVFIQEIVARFQPVIVARHGRPLTLFFYKEDWFQAATGWNKKENSLKMSIYGGVLNLPELERAAVTCHELGHILGDVPLSAIPNYEETKFDPRDSVEGEADYFAGRCMLVLYPKTEHTELINSFVNIVEKASGEKLGHFEQLFDFKGINENYPTPVCRVHSFESGLKLRERPTCWYNPKYYLKGKR
jgi:hypothetical protein